MRGSTCKIVHAHTKDLDHLDLIQTRVELPHEIFEEIVVHLTLGLA